MNLGFSNIDIGLILFYTTIIIAALLTFISLPRKQRHR